MEHSFDDLHAVLASFPQLTRNGWTWTDHAPWIVSPDDEVQFASARKFIRQCWRPRASYNIHATSYGQKHVAERWAGTYICNGVFIAAAIAEGYEPRTEDRSPNCLFKFRALRRELKKGQA